MQWNKKRAFALEFSGRFLNSTIYVYGVCYVFHWPGEKGNTLSLFTGRYFGWYNLKDDISVCLFLLKKQYFMCWMLKNKICYVPFSLNYSVKVTYISDPQSIWVPGFLFSRPNWVPPPPRKCRSSPPPLVPKAGESRGDTLACGREFGGTQFWRRDRHSGTLCILHI
jgi:hypothetical protein